MFVGVRRVWLARHHSAVVLDQVISLSTTLFVRFAPALGPKSFTTICIHAQRQVPLTNTRSTLLLVRSSLAMRGGLGYRRLRWLLALEVFLALGAMWTVGSSSGAWPKHKEPAEVAQQAVVRKAAPRQDFTADAHQDAIPKRSERIAAIISSSVTLATSDSGPLETAANPRPLAKC